MPKSISTTKVLSTKKPVLVSCRFNCIKSLMLPTIHSVVSSADRSFFLNSILSAQRNRTGVVQLYKSSLLQLLSPGSCSPVSAVIKGEMSSAVLYNFEF